MGAKRLGEEMVWGRNDPDSPCAFRNQYRSLVLPNILALGFISNRETVNLTAGAKYARANHASIMCRRKSGKSSICQPDSGEATITVFFTMASENSQEHFWGKAI